MRPLQVSGKAIATRILTRIAGTHVSTTRYLAGFVAASDAAGLSFQRAKRRAAGLAGIDYRIAALPDTDVDNASVALRDAAADPACGGIVLQLPFGTTDPQPLLDLVPAAKDPDVLGAAAYAAFRAGGNILPPAARAVAAILEDLGVDPAPLTVAIVGQGRLVGKPVADWFEDRCALLRRLDIGFDQALLGDADIVILGTGSYVLDPRLLKEGASVIDFGYRQAATGLAGDLDASDPERLARLSFYTPTPGGTGPVLVAALIENFARLNQLESKSAL